MPSQKKQSTILRQWTLLRHCLSTTFKTTQDIHQALIQQGFSITERTLLRDLQQLEEAGLPITRSETKPINWRIEKQWQDKIGGMTDGEALLTILVKDYLRDILPTTMLKQWDSLFLMAEKKLNMHCTQHANQWLNKIRVIAAQQPQLAPTIKEKVKNKISEALMANQVISAKYKGYDFLLSPLALVMRGQILYLAAIDGNELQQVKHFALHRFDEADIAYGELFYSPDNFNIDTLLKEGWGHFQHQQDEKKIHLECWCDVDLKNHLEEMRLAGNQWLNFKKSTNGRHWLKVELPYTWQLKQWLLSQGSKIEVIKPVWLREALQEEIHAMLNNYQS